MKKAIITIISTIFLLGFIAFADKDKEEFDFEKTFKLKALKAALLQCEQKVADLRNMALTSPLANSLDTIPALERALAKCEKNLKRITVIRSAQKPVLKCSKWDMSLEKIEKHIDLARTYAKQILDMREKHYEQYELLGEPREFPTPEILEETSALAKKMTFALPFEYLLTARLCAIRNINKLSKLSDHPFLENLELNKFARHNGCGYYKSGGLICDYGTAGIKFSRKETLDFIGEFPGDIYELNRVAYFQNKKEPDDHLVELLTYSYGKDYVPVIYQDYQQGGTYAFELSVFVNFFEDYIEFVKKVEDILQTLTFDK